MSMNMKQMAMMMLAKQKNNPMAKQALEILKSGDDKAGEEMAMNLCDTYGVSKEDAIQQAQEWAKTALPGNNS